MKVRHELTKNKGLISWQEKIGGTKIGGTKNLRNFLEGLKSNVNIFREPFIYLTLNIKNLRFAFEYVVHKKRQIWIEKRYYENSSKCIQPNISSTFSFVNKKKH